MSDFTFTTTDSVDENLLHSALTVCIDSAKSAIENSVIHENPTNEEVLDFWKTAVRRIVNDEEGLFIHSLYQGNSIGFGFAKTEGNLFHTLGGFYGNVNGSRSYTFKTDWWTAFADFAKAEGYTELRFDIRKGHSLLRCCEIVGSKISYSCEIDDNIYPDSEALSTTFRIYL